MHRPVPIVLSAGRPASGTTGPAAPAAPAAGNVADAGRPPDPFDGSPWKQRLDRLRTMVSRTENQSMRITDAKVRRNREVTRLFFDLGLALDRLLNRSGPPSGANWALWASHASERAGAFIRGDTTILGLKGPGRNHIHLANGLAMGDIGDPVGRFIVGFRHDTAPDPHKLDTFLAALPDDEVRGVFHAYYGAMWEQDPQTKQELTLLGNLTYAGREQVRLDSFLNRALNDLPGPDVVMVPLAACLLGLAGLGKVHGFLTGKLRIRWRGFEANLHEDVPRSRNAENLAVNKVRNYHTLKTPALRQQLDSWRARCGVPGFDGDSMAGSGADDWGDLPARMHFIAEMVREHLCDPGLYTAPRGPADP